MAKEKKPQRSGTVRLDEQYASAKQLYVDHGKEARNIADIVGVGYRTVLNWIKGKEGDPNRPDWQKLRAAQTMSKADQLRDLAAQIQQINAKIKAREDGHRHANSAEADIISKLTKSYNALETDLGIREIVDVATELIPFVKKYNANDADLIKKYFDKFISEKVAKQR